MREKDPDHPVARYCAVARARMGLDPYKMAERIDRSRTAYIQYEEGSVVASTEALLKIAEVSGVSLGVISAFAAGGVLPTDPAVLALAERIAKSPKTVQQLVAKMFAEPADDGAVLAAGFTPMPGGQ